MEDKKTLILIDGHALAFRMFFALERTNMQTTSYIPTWAVYGFFKAVFDLLADKKLSIKPNSIAVAFDVSKATFRLEQYSEYDTIYYTILQTLVELEKQKVSKFVSSELGKYAKLWTLEDIYYMFDNTYKCLIRSRSAQIDIKSDIIILLSLLSFKSIPSMEV